MKVNALYHIPVYRLLTFVFMLLVFVPVFPQDYLKIMPLGNSITYDQYSIDPRPAGDKISYRFALYKHLTDEGYTFDFVGSEQSGGNYLPTASPDYTDNAGFPGITAENLLRLLQTGVNYTGGTIGTCELPVCPQNYLDYFAPDVILLHIGTNGLNTLTDAYDIADDVELILDEIDLYEAHAGKKVPVFLALIINRAPDGSHTPTALYNKLLNDLAESRSEDDIVLVNMETGASLNYAYAPTGDMHDLLHPETTGYDKMALSWFNALESVNLASPDVSDIPDQSKPEGSSFTVDLDDYVFDPQDADDEMSWTYTGNTSFSVSINATTHIATITPNDVNWNGSNTITFRAADPSGSFDADAAIFTLTPVNDPPVDITLSASSVQENQPAGILVGTLSTTDPDAGDSFTYSLVSGTGSTDNSNFTISGSSLLTNTVFDYETKQTCSIRIRTTDSGSLTYEEVFTINILNINEAPVLSNLETNALSYAEGDGAVAITSTITVSDDNTTLQSATIRITSGYQQGEDILSYPVADGFTKDWNATTGTFTLGGNYSLSAYQTALRNIKYENTSSDPVTATRVVTFRVNDGTNNSNQPTRSITVGSVNNPPVLDNIETSPLTYTENADAAPVTTTLTITDSDDASLESATISITSGYQNGQDVLSFTNGNGISGSWNASTGTMTLSGTASVAFYQNALHSVNYSNTSENPSVAARTVSITVYDDADPSNTVTRNISVTAVNDAPVLSGIETSALAYATGSGEVVITNTIMVSDTDNLNLNSATVQITGNYNANQDRLRFTNTAYISGTWNNTTGTITLSGITTLANYRAALRNVRYEQIYTANPNTTARIVEFRVNDGGPVNNLSNVVSRTISFLPMATISGGGNICSSEKATIALTLTGQPNWTVDIRRTGGPLPKDTTITGISTSSYTFETGVAGTYTLLNVADQNHTDGLEYGSATVSVYPAVTAKLTGTSQICQGDASPAVMSVDFTGTSPWTFVFRRNAQDTTYTGITQNPFNFNVTRAGTYKIVSIHDLYCPGDTVAGYGTAVVSYIESPTAILSGIDTTCPGDTAILYVDLEGEGPFSITYLRNGANAKTINFITDLNYTLKVVGDGIYTLSDVTDQEGSGCVSGTGTVVYYSVPTATISSSGAICEHTFADLRITFTGAAPWNFSYHRDTEVPTVVNDITTSPHYISVNQAGAYTLVDVSDKFCNGTVFGTADVSVTPAPEVTISGLDPAYSMQSMEMIPVFGEPEGGIFTPTLMVVNDTNYFLPFAMGVGIHTIVYAYQDGGTGCYGYDTAIVAVLAADAEITFPEDDTKKFFCYNDQPFTIMGHNTANDTGTFTISGGIGLADNNDNTATIDPSQLNGGIYEVTYRYFNKTYLEVKESFEVEYVQNIWFIGFNASSYCDNAGRVPLNGNVTGGIFSGKAVTGNTSAGFYYEPQLASPGMDTVFYTLTTTRGCSRQIYKPLIIRDAADISFTVLDTCVSTDVSDSTVFINNTTCTDPVISWEWNFGDPTSGDNNISTLKNPKHKYVRNGYRNISLTATTDYCQSSGSMNFDFGNKPQADFSWSTECFHEGQKIKFTADSSEDFNIEDYKWKINNGAKIDSFMTKNTEYTFSKEGNYDVELFVRSDYGCTDKITKTIPLKPTYELLEGSSFYDDFEGEIKGWVSVSEDTVNSWTLGEPAFGTPTGGDYVWYTDIAFDSETGRAYKEQSSVTSPCFSFHGIKKPMVGFYLHNDYNDNWNDGAVLQYKADSSKEWKEIGDLNDGIHWYQDYKISGKPGGESIGWSKDSKGPWVEARHSLDELKGKTDVQFRIAYGSDGTPFETNGVAFDNFWIHERNKIVMVEHFTNASDAASKSADSTLDAFVNRNSLDIVDIQYHTSFPGVDPFNEQNKVDPGTRVLYYQLSSVPVTILNGGTNNDYIFDYDNVLLDLLLIKNQSLLDPDFSITLQTSMVNNTLSVDAELRPLREVRDQQVTFHLAIVERIISGVTGANGDTLFESVLKTILSSTSYTNDWDPAVDVKTINKTWNLKNTYNTDEIRVVAFVQNEASKEIYQAMIDLFDVPTALRNENIIHRSKESIGFIVFPNPVRDEAWLRFDEETVKKTRVELFDINGKLIMTQEVFPGAKQYAITMSDCPEGLYFIRITSDNRLMGLQKLVIAR